MIQKVINRIKDFFYLLKRKEFCCFCNEKKRMIHFFTLSMCKKCAKKIFKDEDVDVDENGDKNETKNIELA